MVSTIQVAMPVIVYEGQEYPVIKTRWRRRAETLRDLRLDPKARWEFERKRLQAIRDRLTPAEYRALLQYAGLYSETTICGDASIEIQIEGVVLIPIGAQMLLIDDEHYTLEVSNFLIDFASNKTTLWCIMPMRPRVATFYYLLRHGVPVAIEKARYERIRARALKIKQAHLDLFPEMEDSQEVADD